MKNRDKIVVFDRNSKPHWGLGVTYIRICILVVTLLVVSHAQLGVARTITVEVATDGYDGNGYWIGTFGHPLTIETSPKSWQQIENTKTTLRVGDQEDLVLVALQKGSLPIFKRIRSSTTELSVEFQFRKGKSLREKSFQQTAFQSRTR